MPRYLITGGCGFIGSHLVDALLARGCAIQVIDDLSTGDRTNLDVRAALEVASIGEHERWSDWLQGIDGVFHLAAIASVARCNEEWVASHRVNLTDTVALFAAAAERDVPVVYASSAAVYGGQTAVPLRETDLPLPLSAYGADKLGCEHQARAGATVHGLKSVGLRFFNVFGRRQPPGSPYSGVITIFADRLRRGETLTLHGDGSQTRDFIFVGDIVAGLIAAMDVCREARTPLAEVANLCTGRETSIRTLAETMLRLAGSASTIGFTAARAGDVARSLGDPSHACALLGFEATTKLGDGLAELLG